MPSKKRPLKLAILSLVPLIAAASCATTKPAIPTTVTTADCVNWKTISYSAKSDSEETVRQIIEQNARRKAVCG